MCYRTTWFSYPNVTPSGGIKPSSDENDKADWRALVRYRSYSTISPLPFLACQIIFYPRLNSLVPFIALFSERSKTTTVRHINVAHPNIVYQMLLCIHVYIKLYVSIIFENELLLLFAVVSMESNRNTQNIILKH